MDMTVEVPELPELTFDEASHIYRLNGDIIPSVSKLMEPLKDQCYGGISKRTLENAAIKGSAVHNSIENWIKFGIDDIPSEHRGYFNGFMEWWKQYKPRVFGSEVRIYHKQMRYGGTIDLLCEIGGLLELIDFKTTYSLLEMTCGVQLEAYSQALASHGITPQRKHILHMPKSPSPSNDRISDLMQQKFDLEEDIRATLEHRRRERMFFEKIIRRLKRSDERAVIRSRYLDGASWGDVVDLLYGDEADLLEREDMYRKRVFKLNGRALLSMAQYIEENGLTWDPDDYDETE